MNCLAEPPYSHRHRGTCLVIGAAPCWWDDVLRALWGMEDEGAADIMATCFMAQMYKIRIDHVFSLHAPALEHARAYNYHFAWPSTEKSLETLKTDIDSRTGVKNNPLRLGYRWSGFPHRLSSGPTAALIAVEGLGYDRAILCGVPLDDSGYCEGYPTRPCKHSGHREPMLQVIDRFKGRVFSMSGWTRKVLGEPT